MVARFCTIDSLLIKTEKNRNCFSPPVKPLCSYYGGFFNIVASARHKIALLAITCTVTRRNCGQELTTVRLQLVEASLHSSTGQVPFNNRMPRGPPVLCAIMQSRGAYSFHQCRAGTIHSIPPGTAPRRGQPPQ